MHDSDEMGVGEGLVNDDKRVCPEFLKLGTEMSDKQRAEENVGSPFRLN